MEKRLYEASVAGNVDVLNQLMSEDKLFIVRFSLTCFNETPLHIAAMLGHLNFVKALLSNEPDLTSEVDSQGRSPLHLASGRGYVDIVQVLLSKNDKACLIRDENGGTPLHLAVMKGRVEVMKLLVEARPEVKRYKLNQGETLLHLAVKHNRWEALKLLEDLVTDKDFVNDKDNDGNTILHIATAQKKIETIKYLLPKHGVLDVNALNGKGLTALDIIRLPSSRDFNDMEILNLLIKAGALRAKIRPEIACDPQQVIRGGEISMVRTNSEAVATPPSDAPPTVTVPRQPSLGRILTKKYSNGKKKWLERKRDTLMIVATVLAAMAYQAGLNPPSGVWQDDNLDSDGNIEYFAGTSVMASNYPDGYALFWQCNTASFVASLSTILLLVSGVPLRRRIYMWILMAGMWLTIICMALTYVFTMQAISPDHEITAIYGTIRISMFIWLGLIGIVFLVHTIRFLLWIVRNVKKYRRMHANEAQDQGFLIWIVQKVYSLGKNIIPRCVNEEQHQEQGQGNV